ncbi:cytochrome c oxidase assembly protein [Nocardioides caldifontis]|uniref:cytochrome c oxidase assembly protein n=1 Tax=Nocardioides caldifontis TaxID=2588938 RepID=UPI001EF0C719|nr:cytochrome c oxidase assembly protein [Nocardioides caldifontis]
MLLRTADGSTPALPPFDLGRIVTEAGIDPVATILTIWVAGAYLVGVRVLRARGDRWPVGRTISFVVLGMGSFAFATMSGLGAYDNVMLSVHMVQHMILTMVTPLALALGAPVTLALRTLPARPRRWLLAVVHSTPVKVLSFPPLAFLLFVLSPWVLYFSAWYPASAESTYVHEMTHLHLVATGALFLWPLVGVDPVPGRVAYPFRMLLMVLTLPFHAFLGVTIMNQDALIAEDHFRGLGLDWLPDPMDDQHLAGGILWGTGDVVGLIFFMALFAQWVRSSMREAEREDRRLDRLERQERQDRQNRLGGPEPDPDRSAQADAGGRRVPAAE